MYTIDKIMSFLRYSVKSPKSFGLFHWFFIISCIVVTALLIIFALKVKAKTFRNIVFSLWCVMLFVETYKQLVHCYDGQSWWYDWSTFPFQLCSTPFYLLPIIIFGKDGKIRDATIFYMGSFALFGGICVYAFPDVVFATDILGLHLQTMIHHGVQIALGIYIPIYYAKKFNLKNFLGASIMFLALTLIALTLNLIIAPRVDQTFNLFYIGPHHPCELPILSTIYQSTPFIVFLLLYVFGYTAVALLVTALLWGGIILARKTNKKQETL